MGKVDHAGSMGTGLKMGIGMEQRWVMDVGIKQPEFKSHHNL